MPGMNGVEGIARMRQAFPETPVVVLTGSVVRGTVLAADAAGAAAYLTKTMSGKALVNALRLVLAGGRYLPPEALLGNGAAGEPVDRPAVETPIQLFTPRERQVLDHLAEGHSNKEIARQLGLQEISVKVHLKKIFRKLNVSNRTQAAMAAVRFMGKD